MKAYHGILLVVVLALSPTAASAACPTGAFGPVIFTRVEIASNPLVSGQNGGALFLFRNTNAAQAQGGIIFEVDIADDQHQVVVPNIIRFLGINLQPGATFQHIVPFSTAGAVFSGFIHARVSVGGNCNDLAPLRLVILPPCPCPAALPAPIPAYLAPQ